MKRVIKEKKTMTREVPETDIDQSMRQNLYTTRSAYRMSYISSRFVSGREARYGAFMNEDEATAH